MRELFLLVALSLAVLGVYGQTLGFEFTNLDDPIYVTANPAVRAGLTGQGVLWAATTAHEGNWVPLTFLSHMLDVQIFGLNAGGHHAMNVLLHMLNALLLYGFLATATRKLGASFVVAGLFALHPLHVESVAWVAERKDVLSTAFGLGALLAWTRHTRTPSAAAYASALGLFALSLLAKPMWVTLPFLLLVLDYWPLRRSPESGGIRAWRDLVVEKLPFLGLAAVFCVITLATQQRGIYTDATLIQRIDNALVVYVGYLIQTFWPVNLAPLYPHPNLPGGTPWPIWQIVLSALALGAISAGVYFGRRHRYLVAGWLWYLGTLVPVIGMVQAGLQSGADRYTYVPLVGFFIMVVFGVAELASRRRNLEWIAHSAGGAALIVCAALAFFQVQHWRDGKTLYEHGLAIEPGAWLLHVNLGILLEQDGDRAAAIKEFDKALIIHPRSFLANVHLGTALRAQGQALDSLTHYRRALEVRPDVLEARFFVGRAYAEVGSFDQAAIAFESILAEAPDDASVNFALGNAFADQKQYRKAEHYYKRTLELAPNFAPARENLERIAALRAEAGTSPQGPQTTSP